MEKRLIRIILAATGVAGLCFLLLGISDTINKKASAIAIIGGADGPTSVFLAGKVGTNANHLEILVGGILLLIVIVYFVVKKKKRTK